jgi:hypothetical protein
MKREGFKRKKEKKKKLNELNSIEEEFERFIFLTQSFKDQCNIPRDSPTRPTHKSVKYILGAKILLSK